MCNKYEEELDMLRDEVWSVIGAATRDAGGSAGNAAYSAAWSVARSAAYSIRGDAEGSAGNARDAAIEVKSSELEEQIKLTLERL